MPKTILGSPRSGAAALGVVAALALAPFLHEMAAQGEPAESPCRPATRLPDPADPDLDCPAPPGTFDVSGFFASDASPEARAAAGPTWDAWAWASFAAMSWPAREAVGPGFPSGYVRGVPDLERSFLGARPDDVTVWETFKEKREVFNRADPPVVTRTSEWQALTFDPAQQPRPEDAPPGAPGLLPCDETLSMDRVEDVRHRVLQGTKQPSVSGDNTFDETVEVASQALEEAAVLCAGYPKGVIGGDPSYEDCVRGIFPDGDRPGRTPVGPRVWKGDPGTTRTARPVFYEVKVNYDFWDYITSNGFFDDQTAFDAARSPVREDHPKLPFRTSAPSGPGRSPGARFAYEASQVAGEYATGLDDPNVLPRVGSVHLKAAWLHLTEEEVRSGDYHTTEGLFFRTREGFPQGVCYDVATFGLLGLHIIQRVHALRVAPDENTATDGDYAHGGTFVFATWEHTSLGNVEEPTDYYYVNFLAQDTNLRTGRPFNFPIDERPFPDVTAPGQGTPEGQSGIPVVRLEDYPLPSTREVNRAVHAAIRRTNGDSVWLNYRLIGTQFVALSSEEESLAFNQPYYLANLVVETNTGLQRFQGLPPKVDVTPYYTRKVTLDGTGGAFARSQPNVIFNRERHGPFNMGGCMGCHGVAQLNGYNFSFVFQDGQRGSSLDTQTHFEVAPGAPSPD